MSNPEQLKNELKEIREHYGELENQLKQQEKALQQDRHLLAIVLDMTDDLIRNFVGTVLDIANALVVVCDSQGRILNCNQFCEQTTNYSLSEVKGKYIWDVFAIPEEVDKVKALYQKPLADESVEPYESTLLTKEGLYRHISWCHSTIKTLDGSIRYILGTGVDISERKQAEAEMYKALKQQKELNELKARLITTTSHEFRTPLATILSSAELLEHYACRLPEPEKQHLFENIKTATQRIVLLLDEVLTINQAEKIPKL